MQKIFWMVLLLTVCLMLGACGREMNEVGQTNEADYPFYATAQELVEAADLIFSGSVERVTCEVLDVRTETGTDSLNGSSEAQGILYTLYEIKVSEVYKGTFEEDTLTVKCPGGEVDGSLHISDDVSAISQGETYLFLTVTYENTYPSLLNADQAL